MTTVEEDILQVLDNVQTNTINEYTATVGVTVDGVLIKDGLVDGRDISTDGVVLDNHVASTANPHAVTIDQITPTTTKGDLIAENGTNAVRLAVGADGQILSALASAPEGFAWVDPGAVDSGVVSTVVRDEKTTATNGGTFTSGAWRTRDLNVLLDSEGGTQGSPSSGGISLASNQLTIPVGTYFVIASATAYQVEGHQARLRNITDGVTAAFGTSQIAKDSAQGSAGPSTIYHVLTVSVTAKVFELQHRCEKTQNNTGFGRPAGIPGNTEVYSHLIFHKIKN